MLRKSREVFRSIAAVDVAAIMIAMKSGTKRSSQDANRAGVRSFHGRFTAMEGLWEEGVRNARDWIARADLILVIGTHGNYGDAYWGCRSRNAAIVQINPGHTGFDRAAKLNIREECDEVFKKLRERREKNG